MASILESQAPVNPQVTLGTILDEAVQTLRQVIGARISSFLVAAVDDAVGRAHYVRRKRLSERLQGEAKCYGCASRPAEAGVSAATGFGLASLCPRCGVRFPLNCLGCGVNAAGV